MTDHRNTTKRRLLKTGLIWLVIGVAFAASAGGVASQTSLNPAELLKDLMPDPRVWEGTITITRIGSRNFKEDRSRGGATDTVTTTRTVSDHTTIHACGVTGSLYVTSVERSLMDNFEHREYKRAAVTTCAAPDDMRAAAR